MLGFRVFVAALNPPSLKCIFAPHGLTDFYRDWIYRGGIFAYNFIRALAKDYRNPRFELITRKMFGEEELKKRIAKAFQDEDLMAIPGMAEVLKNIDEGINPIMADVMLNPLDGPFWEERKAKYDTTKVPAYHRWLLGNLWAPLTRGISELGKLKSPQKDGHRPANVSGSSLLSIPIRVTAMVRPLAKGD